MMEWRYSSTNLDNGTRWRWVVSLMPRPFYLRKPLDGRLGGAHSRYERCGEEEKSPAPDGNWIPAIQPVAIHTTLKFVVTC
jgi:hypothetical protein